MSYAPHHFQRRPSYPIFDLRPTEHSGYQVQAKSPAVSTSSQWSTTSVMSRFQERMSKMKFPSISFRSKKKKQGSDDDNELWW